MYYFFLYTPSLPYRYIDRFLQMLIIPKDRLHIVAMACFIIAAKYEEKEIDIPTIPDLVCHFQYQRSLAEDVAQMEVLILNKYISIALYHSRFGWNINYATASHFLGYYLSAGALFSDDKCNGVSLSQRIVIKFEKYIKFFAELSMREYYFQQYKSSELACAILMACRKLLRFEVPWRSEHQYLTGYSIGEIEPIMNGLWDEYVSKYSKAQSSSPDNVQSI